MKILLALLEKHIYENCIFFFLHYLAFLEKYSYFLWSNFLGDYQ